MNIGWHDSEAGPWFDYPVGEFTICIAYKPGASEMVSMRTDGHTQPKATKIGWLADLLRSYEVGPFG